jgi:beta-RFAP synthase
MKDAVFVEAPARLHFGVLDLRGSLGRRFGGIGTAAPAPTLLLSASPADALEVAGTPGVPERDIERAAMFARRFLAHHGLKGGARLTVHRTLPAHAGLGSGTQLALAVARALADVHDVASDAVALAVAVGRTKRSAIGTWTFAGGGLVLEGGKRLGGEGVGPLLARLPFPPGWRCVVAVPSCAPRMSGADEEAALAQLPAPPEREVERVAHLVLMGLLPAVVDADVARFGSSLSAIQATTGGWWASVQGGAFLPGVSAELACRMAEWGASGVGQSSWGPTVYGIVDGEESGRCLADRTRAFLDPAGVVYEGPFRTEGARIWHAPIPEERPGTAVTTPPAVDASTR